MRKESNVPFDTHEGVYAFLLHYPYLESDAIYKANYNTLALLIEFDRITKPLAFTTRQQEAIHLVFMKGLTQREAGTMMGISQQAVQQLIRKVVHKIVSDASDE